MKFLAFLILSAMLAGCASNSRQIASEEQEELQEFEQRTDYDSVNRY